LILEKIKDGWSSAAFLNKMDEADALLSELGNKNEISADLANRIKKFIDNSRSTASFHINPNMSEKQAAMKFTADSLRGSLKDTYGFMKKTLNDESKAYEIFNGMLHKATKKPEGISAALRSLGPLDLALDILGSKGAASSMKTINNLFNQVGFRTTTAQFLKKLAEGRATPEGKKTMETLGKLYRTSPQLIRNKMSIPFLPNEYSNE
jgi:hypothetical protein